jgi:hypothetical protein
VVLLVVAALLAPLQAQAQNGGLKLAIGDVGIGIGDVRRLDGVRLNIRDQNLERVRGLNVTLWAPRKGAQGLVQGLAIGAPLTGAGTISGLTVGVGTGAEHDLSGFAVGVLGLGAGENLSGIALGGLGVGAGKSVRGIALGGIGAGSGEDLDGLAAGVIGVGAGRSVRGIVIGGIGAGAGERVTGLAIGGVGVGAGSDISGIAIGGIGVGCGGHLTGLAIGGLGVGAPQLTGAAVGLFAGGREVTGLMIVPLHLKVDDGGAFSGLSLSAFNRIDGTQHGATIGILNIARELHGVQIGVLNIAYNKTTLPILPLVNFSR